MESNEEQQSENGILTIEKAIAALKNTKNDKAPGHDILK